MKFIAAAAAFATLATAATTSSFACNPAHDYQNGQTCISTNGALTLINVPASGNATAAATNAVVTVTSIVATYTTFCPQATAVTTNGKTYTATAGQTLTITDCPCTIVKGITTSPVKATTAPAASSKAATTAPAVATSAKTNGTAPATKPSTTKPAAFTGAADKVAAAGGLFAIAAAFAL